MIVQENQVKLEALVKMVKMATMEPMELTEKTEPMDLKEKLEMLVNPVLLVQTVLLVHPEMTE